ncbi:MAG: glycosyltransferase family 2 protein [Candidatus Margulisiibacteriota bacterium]
MSPIKISVCITTRNRAKFIGEALDSIISQANDEVEIVIVDGASTDNTKEVVESYQKKSKNLVYHREAENHGVDRDMAKTLQLARGEYCWLFSDDDTFKPGAFKRMLKEIESGCEIYLCNITSCDHEMRPIRERYWLDKKTNDRTFALHNKKELIEYCNLANSIGALFSYWSAVVVKREAWLKTGFLDEFDGSAYAMAATLLSFLNRQCRLKYIRDSLVLWRSDNESFQHAGGLVKRFLLDFDGYMRLADKYLLANDKSREAFLTVMTREHPWYTIVNVTSQINNAEQWRSFREKMLKFGYSPSMAAICYALGRYKKLISLGVTIKRKLVRAGFLR